jgi:DNA repair protein RadA/Sms
MKNKEKIFYICNSCGFTTTKWMGKCPQCGSWNSFEEKKESKSSGRIKKKKGEINLKTLTEFEIKGDKRFSTGIEEFDRVLGGGIVKGEVILIGGEPGIGKSTLLLQTVENVSKNKKVLYVTGEESSAQIKLRADRLGLKGDKIYILSTNSAEDIIYILEQEKFDLLILDSIQTIFFETMDYSPGSVVQIREVASKFIEISKSTGLATFIVGHITKGGDIAGPKVLEHLVDAVLYFEGDRFHQGRILRAIKNRFGASFEIGLFEITGKGLIPMKDPFKLWGEEKRERESGIAIFPAIEGSRPLLVEIQSLVSPSPFTGNPRRMFLGVDRNRATMLVAVLEKRVGFKFYQDDIFIKISGGLTIQDPAIDLAIAVSLISSKTGIKIKKDAVFMGEVSLGGLIMSPYMSAARIKESEKFGFTEIWTSEFDKEIKAKNVIINRLKYIRELKNIFNKKR